MIIKVCIQVAAGSREKRRYNEKTLEYKGMSRGSLPYPYPYGFILGTNGSDGDNLDCYLITREHLQAGTIVECEAIGLLEQVEDGEIDHKVLAAIPGQQVETDQELGQVLREFIYSVFRQFQDVHVHVGELLPRQAALDYIQEYLEA
jgi:inorganic pyrophosphatase